MAESSPLTSSGTSASSQATTTCSASSQATTTCSASSQATTTPSASSQATTTPSASSQATTTPSASSQATTTPSASSQATTTPSASSQATTTPSASCQATTTPSASSQATTSPSASSQATTTPSASSQATTTPSSKESWKQLFAFSKKTKVTKPRQITKEDLKRKPKEYICLVCEHELAMKTKWYGDRHWAEQHKKDPDYDYNKQIVHISSIPKRVTSTFFHIFPHFSSLPVHFPNSCCKLHYSKEKMRLPQTLF